MGGDLLGKFQRHGDKNFVLIIKHLTALKNRISTDLRVTLLRAGRRTMSERRLP